MKRSSNREVSRQDASKVPEDSYPTSRSSWKQVLLPTIPLLVLLGLWYLATRDRISLLQELPNAPVLEIQGQRFQREEFYNQRILPLLEDTHTQNAEAIASCVNGAKSNFAGNVYR